MALWVYVLKLLASLTLYPFFSLFHFFTRNHCQINNYNSVNVFSLVIIKFLFRFRSIQERKKKVKIMCQRRCTICLSFSSSALAKKFTLVDSHPKSALHPWCQLNPLYRKSIKLGNIWGNSVSISSPFYVKHLQEVLIKGLIYK